MFMSWRFLDCNSSFKQHVAKVLPLNRTGTLEVTMRTTQVRSSHSMVTFVGPLSRAASEFLNTLWSEEIEMGSKLTRT